jgi:hypothetical protein
MYVIVTNIKKATTMHHKRKISVETYFKTLYCRKHNRNINFMEMEAKLVYLS